MCFTVGADKLEEHCWYVDFGATSHMCSNEIFFTNINRQHQAEVTLADEQKLKVVGIGEGFVQLDERENRNIFLTNVLFVSDLRGNLISMKKLANKGFEVHFKESVCEITKSGRLVASEIVTNGLYELHVMQRALKMSDSKQVLCIHGWHNRLGHRDPNAVKQIEKFNMTENFLSKPCYKKIGCKCCIKAKMTRTPIPKVSDTKTAEILDLVHTDLCGPIEIATVGGKRYVMTMINDYSRYTKIYLLPKKSDVSERIHKYVGYVKTKFQKSVKRIRSDRGGEYVNEEMQIFMKSEGIQYELTAPYTPQQNGRGERKNRYLVEMSRSMLTDAEQAKKFLGEAMVTTNHLRNRLPVDGLLKTPYEEWHSRKPDLHYVRRFGCKAFMHIPDEKRKKLDVKAKELTLLAMRKERKASDCLMYP